MHTLKEKLAQRTPCSACPLKELAQYRSFTGDELNFISRFKTGELTVDAGATVLVEGAHSAHLYTVLTGWSFRHKILPDGRRQILNYGLPGSLVGLQGSLMGEMQHSVEALTAVTLCVFERHRLMELFEKHASLAYDMTWIAAREERVLDEHLLSVGRRSALESAAFLLSSLAARARSLQPKPSSNAITLPLTQSHVADTLGLSIVHTNKTLKKLAARGLIKWLDRGCEVSDLEGLAAVAKWEIPVESSRPFI